MPSFEDWNNDQLQDLIVGEDFTILVRALGKPVPPGGSPADLNEDGAVDNVDLRLFADLWPAEHATKDTSYP